MQYRFAVNFGTLSIIVDEKATMEWFVENLNSNEEICKVIFFKGKRRKENFIINGIKTSEHLLLDITSLLFLDNNNEFL